VIHIWIIFEVAVNAPYFDHRHVSIR
jgi:hypothetical protein